MKAATLKRLARRLGWCVPLFIGLQGPALAERSGWADADQSQLRLLLSPGAAGEAISGGLEIVLNPDWYTYWRNPGEAGVPPEFDFSGSQNIATVEVLYPAPERHDDGVSVSLIYRDEVVFPLIVAPIDGARPVTVKVEAKFGVCRDVCIPTRASAEVTLLPSAANDPLTDARLRSFAPRVPKAPEPGRFDVESVTVADDALFIDLRVPESGSADLFAEAPAGWYIGQPSLLSRQDGISRYRLPLAGRPHDTAIAGQTFRFVATAGGEAIEEAIVIR